MKNTGDAKKDWPWLIPDALMSDSSDGQLFFKVLFLPKLSKSEAVQCGKQEIQERKAAFLGQLSEQLSTGFACGLSSVGLFRTKGGDDDNYRAKRSKDQGSFDFLRLAFSFDKFFDKCSRSGEESLKKQDDINAVGLSFASFVLPIKPYMPAKVEAAKEAGNEIMGPIAKLFPGLLVHILEPGPRQNLKEEAKRGEIKNDGGNDMFAKDLLRELSALTKVLGFKKESAFGFARVQGEPSIMEPQPFEEENTLENHSFEASRPSGPRPGIPRFTVKLPNIENLMELVPQLGKSPQSFPDKRKLFSVEDFFKYTEAEGKKLFDELDRDKDGQVTLEDLEVAMRKRRLPQRYAREFLRRTKKHWLKKSFGWNEFLSLMEQKEPVMLRAFNSLSVSKSGTLQKVQVLTLLRNAGLPATEENAAAMMRFLDSDTEGSVTYGQFRNFLLLLPPERLFDDPRMVWFEAATVVPMSPPMEVPAGSVLKSALAGGLACALSTSLMHPLDTLKTRVQASTLSFPELISNIPNIGVRGLYRGSAPAIIGQFSSHGLRTGIFEASKLLLFNITPTVSELQIQSLSSFCSTFLGTAVRIPCEVLKQRLQAGLYDNVGEAIVGTLRKDGWKGFFRGTGATLCREVPFYVAGMLIYEEAKKVVQNVIKRELAPWEVIAIGGLSGGLAAVCTTPFDVMKTRMMTSPPGLPVTMTSVTVKIVSEEGLLALFKGAIPRFFWIAPLGAMNFAGYELAKRAMEKKGQ